MKNSLKQYKKAIKDFNKAIELKPLQANFYNNRGKAKDSLKQRKKAQKDYEKAIELNPSRYNRDMTKIYYWKRGEYQKAE